MAFIKTTHTNGITVVNSTEVQCITIDPTQVGTVKVTIELGLASMTTSLTIFETVLATATAALAALIAAGSFINFTDADGKIIYIRKSSIAGAMVTNKDSATSYLFFTFMDVGSAISYTIPRAQATTVINAIHTQLTA